MIHPERSRSGNRPSGTDGNLHNLRLPLSVRVDTVLTGQAALNLRALRIMIDRTPAR